MHRGISSFAAFILFCFFFGLYQVLYVIWMFKLMYLVYEGSVFMFKETI